MTCQRLSGCYYSLIIILALIIITDVWPLPGWSGGRFVAGQSEPNQFDQIFKELNILTRQQLEPPSLPPLAVVATTTSKPSVTSSSTSGGTIATASKNVDQFQLPPRYDPKRAPKRRPVVVLVNLTVLDAAIDRQENVVVLDMKLIESWRDRRLRLRKSNRKSPGADDHADDDDDDDDDDGDAMKRTQAFVLGPEWLPRLWHPVSRLRNNAHVTNALFEKPKQALQKIIEQENLVETVVVVANTTTATVWTGFKMRVNIPVYECRRDDSRLYPFDKIQCSFHIANALYDKKTLVYQWDGQTKWDHNEYHSGQFYLRHLTVTVQNESIIDIDESGNEHSVMRIDFILQRQIGDYILNVYVLHIFLLALCLSTFWISSDNIAVRMTLSIIILIIIKFQTFQALRDEHRIVSALSVWTFGLSCLVIVAILCHILSYYSIQNEWNDKILARLIESARKNRQRQWTPPDFNLDNGPGSGRHRRGAQFANNININISDNNIHSTSVPPTTTASAETANNNSNNNLLNAASAAVDAKANLNSPSSPPTPAAAPTASSRAPSFGHSHSNLKYFKRQCNKAYNNLLVWLNSIIVDHITDHRTGNHHHSSSNLVDILARIILTIIYILFIIIYFVKYAT